MEYIIYKHTSKTSGKSYIGKTSSTVKKRFNEHVNHAKNNKIKTTHFHNALLKYGKEDFETEILEHSIYKNVDEREIYWIKYFDTYENGYNQTKGGDGATGYKRTFEHTEKIRKANLGSKRTSEQKKNISDAHKGQIPWNKGISTDISHLHKEITCPYCNKSGNIGVMKRWHFDYCKANPNQLTRSKIVQSDESNKKRSVKMKGLVTVLDTRDNIRKSVNKEDFYKFDYYVANTKGIKYNKKKCPHCNKMVAPQGKRWHFDKCKFKEK